MLRGLAAVMYGVIGICNNSPQIFEMSAPFWRYFGVEHYSRTTNYVDVSLSVDGFRENSTFPSIQLGSYVNYGPMRYCTITCLPEKPCHHWIRGGDPCFKIVQHYQFDVIVQSSLNYTATYKLAVNMSSPFQDICSSNEPPNAIAIIIGTIIGAIVLGGCIGLCAYKNGNGGYVYSSTTTSSTPLMSYAPNTTTSYVQPQSWSGGYTHGGTQYGSFNAMRDANPRTYTSGYAY